MNSLVKFAVVGIGGLSVGLISAQKLIDGYGDVFTTKQGPWVGWPTAGTRSTNPYVRAHYLSQDRLPISQFEITELEAHEDSQGRKIEANCNYTISGPMPKARWWSIYTFSTSTRTPATPLNTGTNSQQLIFDSDSKYRINLSKHPQTGNWIAPAGESELTLILRFYNPVQSITKQFDMEGLPGIKRVDCQ